MEAKKRCNVQKLALSCMTGMAIVHCVLPILTPLILRINMPSDMMESIVAIVLGVAFSALLYVLLIRTQLCCPQESVSRSSAKSERNASVDLARALAAFLVCFVHVFLFLGYYEAPMVGKVMFGFTGLRTIALLCIPLFMLITGYLCIDRTAIDKVYRSIGSFMGSVLLLTTAAYCIATPAWSLSEGISYILNTLTDEGAWYVCMYAGLLLLMPFLNTGWEKLDHKSKQTLLLILMFLCCARSFSKRFFYTYWVGLYPLTYYFLGGYLRQYPLRLKGGTLVLLFTVAIMLVTLRTYVTSYNGIFEWNQFGNFQCDYNAFFVMVGAVLLFSLIIRLRTRSRLVVNFLKLLGKNTLGIYLLSGAIQARFLSALFEKLDLSWKSLLLWFLYVVATCLISAFFSQVVFLLKDGIGKLLKWQRQS